MPRRDNPILVLDSGLGGLTVVRAMLNRMPGEQIIYFGDTARLPYGSKTKQTVTHFVQQIISWGLRYNPKQVVIGCNTASALCLASVRQTFAPLTITGVVEPGARAASAAAGAKAVPIIGVIATEATVRSEAYQHAIARRRRAAQLLLRPTPLLVPMIEEGRSNDDPLVDLALRQYLQPMLDRKLDVLVLGCTHYPLLKKSICAIVGERVRVIDSAEQCAEDVAARLRASKLDVEPRAMDDRQRVSAFVTDDPQRFEKLAPRFLGFAVDRPTLVAPETLYQSDHGAGETGETIPLRLPA
jgi:glutamate racemase